MAYKTLSEVLGGDAAGGGYDATAYQMIKTAVSAAAITAGWELADRREVFDRLAYNLYGVSISEVTADAAFDNATDSLALAQNADFIADLNGETYLDVIGRASSELVDYLAVFGGDLSTASYASKTVSVASQESNPFGMAFSADGTAMYIVGITADTVYQYTLSTPWDVSTASYASKSVSVASETTVPRDVVFSADGTAMYIVEATASTIYQYTLSTAWDVSTASYASKSVSVSTQHSGVYTISFSSDGSSMYATGPGSATIYQYTLSTPWDVSTASYASKSVSVSSPVSQPGGLAFSAGGASMFVSNQANGLVYQYTLSTPWDVSTASYASKSVSVVPQDNSIKTIAFSAAGTAMYALGNTGDAVFQYSCTALTDAVFAQAA